MNGVKYLFNAGMIYLELCRCCENDNVVIDK